MHGPSVLYDDNTGYLILDEFRDSEVPSQYIGSAVVTCESIKTLGGVTLTGPIFPLAMPFVSGSNGKYRVKIVDTLAGAANGETVEAHVKAVVGADVANIYLRFPVKKRVV